MKARKGKFDVNKDEILRRNVNINKDTVAAHERLEREFEKIGVEIKPSYNLEPPS